MTLLALSTLTTSSATAGDELLARFAECFTAETGEPLDDETLAALADSVDDASAALARQCSAECEGGAPPCDAVADAWATALQLPGAQLSGPVPDWATELSAAIVDRVGACYYAETGERLDEQQSAAVAAYGSTLGGLLVSLTDALGCTPGAAEIAPCLSSIRTQPCDALAGGLDAGTGAFATETDACSAFFACSGSADDEAVDELFAREIGGGGP